MSLPTRTEFTSWGFFTLAVAVIVGGVGCDQILVETGKDPNTTVSQSESPPGRTGFLKQRNDAASPPAGNTVDPAAPDPRPRGANPANNPVARQPAQTNVPPIRLSVGVALAQTLPNGTGMSFSVDYQFRDGRPNQSNKYVWVIQRGDGKSLGRPVQLTDKENLTLIVPRLRPEAGPFTSHILEVSPDGSRRRISNSIGMR